MTLTATSFTQSLSAAHVPPGQTIRVLLADDHEVVRAGVRLMLSQQPGFDIVAEAANGTEAVELFRTLRPDVALVDLRMPTLSGVDTVRRIRLIDPSARVMILTTYDTDDDIERALQAGATGYLLKDVSAEELATATRKASRGEVSVAPAVAAKLADRVRRVQLTAREVDVLRLLVDGKANKEIARELFITESTVKLHTNNLFQKLGVSSRTEAMREAIRRGLVRIQ
jgi:two-component system NarL family response regulator